MSDGHDLAALLGRRVRAQVDGWKESRLGELSAPGLDEVPLFVTGTLTSRQSPVAGTIYSAAGHDLVTATIKPLNEAVDDQPPWDAPEFAERTDARYPWRARLRRHQSWYREHVLGLEPGTIPGPDGPRPVASMLPAWAIDADPSLNFLADGEIEKAAARRIRTHGWGGLVRRDRLYDNLLSSQPLCFNLFVPLGEKPEMLCNVLRDVFGADAQTFVDMRIEWAPPPAEHLGSGSAFDCFIEYRTATGRGFVGVETKYAEDLRVQRFSTDPSRYERATEKAGSGFLSGAAERLGQRRTTSQLWYNALLAQSLRRADSYDEGFVVMVACADDDGARRAAEDLRLELEVPDSLVRHATYEQILGRVDGDDWFAGWADHFRQRYLDLSASNPKET